VPGTRRTATTIAASLTPGQEANTVAAAGHAGLRFRHGLPPDEKLRIWKGERPMRTVYKVLAYLVAAEVAVQAMAMVFAIAGLGKWVQDGGVLDKAAMESEDSPFPEVVGFMIHGINGMMIIPAIALLLLISSFFARIPGGVRWAVLVFVLVVVQVNLGMFGHEVPAVGALHGLNALALFGAAIYTAGRTRATEGSGAAEPQARITMPV
jgi:Family of unknown function (DUF6220)